MGLIRQVASIMMLGGVSSHTRREPPGKAERARAKAERARGEASQAPAATPPPPRSPAAGRRIAAEPGMAVSGD
jgi:hypothetical protein